MRSERGQATLETVLVLPIILLLFCAIVDFGRILYAKSHLNLIAQEAVRLAGLGENDVQIVEYVKNNANINSEDSIKVSITPDDVNRKSGDYVTVNINYGMKYITPIVSVFLPSPFEVNISSTIRVE